MKKAVYRWLLSHDLKAKLEREARLHKVSVSSILDIAVREWLRKNESNVAGDESQRELHAAAEKYIGVLSGLTPGQAGTVRKLFGGGCVKEFRVLGRKQIPHFARNDTALKISTTNRSG